MGTSDDTSVRSRQAKRRRGTRAGAPIVVALVVACSAWLGGGVAAGAPRTTPVSTGTPTTSLTVPLTPSSSLSVTPTAGPVGTLVTVHGSCAVVLHPSQVMSSLIAVSDGYVTHPFRIDTRVTTGPSGTYDFSSTFTIPDTLYASDRAEDATHTRPMVPGLLTVWARCYSPPSFDMPWDTLPIASFCVTPSSTCGGTTGGTDAWGFNYISHTAAPPGTELTGALMRQISHDTPSTPTGDSAQPIRIADQMCNDVVDSVSRSLLDASGRTIATDPAGPSPPMVIPVGTAPGTYFLRITCDYGTEVGDFGVAPPHGGGLALTNPVYRMPVGVRHVSQCVRVVVTAPGTASAAAFDIGPPHGAPLTAASPPLRSDPCPGSLWTLVGGLAGRLGIGVGHVFDVVLAGIAPLAPTTTTSTTRPSSVPTTLPAAPAADVTPPTLISVTFTGCSSAKPPSVMFQVSATDNVGVATVTYTSTYNGGSGPGGTMQGGPTTFTATVSPTGSGGSFSVTVRASDAAGNLSAPQTITRNVC